MAKTGFKLPGFTTWVERIKNVTAKEAAELIVEELQERGPAWTGEFRNNWVIVTGTGKRIPATKETSYVKRERFTKDPPLYEPKKTITAPKFKGRKDNGYTIGNVMKYRDIALDLDPGGWRTQPRKDGGPKNNTAPKDWYITFVQGGKLREILEAATLKAAKDPTIKGFKAGSRSTRFS